MVVFFNVITWDNSALSGPDMSNTCLPDIIFPDPDMIVLSGSGKIQTENQYQETAASLGTVFSSFLETRLTVTVRTREITRAARMGL